MLHRNQEIIYRRNGKELCRLVTDDCKKIDIATLQYIRDYQPFTEPGNFLTIPFKKREKRSSTLKTVSRKENVLVCGTGHSTYEIEYVNIDLEQMLIDGAFFGVNEEGDGINPPYFPLDHKVRKE